LFRIRSNGASRSQRQSIEDRRSLSAAQQVSPSKLGDRGEVTMSPGLTRILILGGGFGGVYTALTLEQLLRHDLRRGAVEIALVNRENYMVFQPMLPEVISGSIGLVDTITPIRRL